jgi:hypothetical protein
MSLMGATRFLERSRFFNGQRLFASDLQAIEEFNREMRWLHNQSLHQPGIGSGFAISGKKGDRQVAIQPGYAIDALGREIVLTESELEPVPPVADDGFGGPVYFDLTVSYPEDAALKITETRDGVCVDRGAIRLREAPVFCWVRLGPPPDRLPTDANLRSALQLGARLRLGRAQVLNCQLDQPISIAQRRNARPAEQPYVACGRSEGEWQIPEVNALGIGLEIITTVDTSDAQFRTPPCYTAHLLGDRHFAFEVAGHTVLRMLDGFVTISVPDDSQAPTSFDFSLLIPDSLLTSQPNNAADPDPRTAADFTDQFRDQLAAKGWRVEWMGVEG